MTEWHDGYNGLRKELKWSLFCYFCLGVNDPDGQLDRFYDLLILSDRATDADCNACYRFLKTLA
jgi:hypothetical protein